MTLAEAVTVDQLIDSCMPKGWVCRRFGDEHGALYNQGKGFAIPFSRKPYLVTTINRFGCQKEYWEWPSWLVPITIAMEIAEEVNLRDAR